MNVAKNLTWERTTQILSGISIFLIPFQIKKMLFSAELSAQGGFNEFSNFFIFAFHLTTLLALLVWAGRELIVARKITLGTPFIAKIISGLIIFASWGVFLAQDKKAALALFCYFALAGILYFLLLNSTTSPRLWVEILLASLLVQVLIATLQSYFQHSLGLHILGEPSLSPADPGVAKITLLGINTNYVPTKFLRAYGTLPHPNILGGFLSMGILFAFSLKKSWYRILTQLLLAAGLILTFSRSAILALVVALIYFAIATYSTSLRKGMLITLTVLIITSAVVIATPLRSRLTIDLEAPEIHERLQQLGVSKNMLIQQPWGIGLNQFTSQMNNFTTEKLKPWEFQPVHNVFLLMLTELGVIALIIPIIFFAVIFRFLHQEQKHFMTKERKETILITQAVVAALIVLMTFDHYLYSLPQGIALTALIIAFISRNLLWLKKSPIQKVRHHAPSETRSVAP